MQWTWLLLSVYVAKTMVDHNLVVAKENSKRILDSEDGIDERF